MFFYKEIMSKNIFETAEEIINLYEMFGNADYIGEPVSQIEHMCQSAELAADAKAEEDVILAAFLHDIGHLCAIAYPQQKLDNTNYYGVINHEQLGADFLSSKGFSANIVNMVSNHVNAKRYLTYKFPEYFFQLSDASKETLQIQGGQMTLTEAMTFEADAFFNNYIMLRRWDEQAKAVHKPLPDLKIYKAMIESHLVKQIKYK